jgi:HlyD family secretion protein
MPFTFLDIYSTSKGILKATQEKGKLISLYSGRVKKINISDNKTVLQGDTLLIIDNAIGSEKIKLLTEQLEEAIMFSNDLHYLSNSSVFIEDSIQSVHYQKQLLQYNQKLGELKTKHDKALRDYLRQQKLFKKGVIAKVEFENNQYNLNLAKNELDYFKKQQRNQWQTELTQQKNSTNELKSSLLQSHEEQNNYVIIAPVNGTIQNLAGLNAESFITAGTVLAEISPDTDLIVECYVSPNDIGLLKPNNPVKFQIDAYNYNQWGMATGSIIEIGKDIIVLNEMSVFKVTCRIDQQELSLKNGFVGALKKGMTLNARFFVANRSVYDLLYDKVDDWLNPGSQNTN